MFSSNNCIFIKEEEVSDLFVLIKKFLELLEAIKRKLFPIWKKIKNTLAAYTVSTLFIKKIKRTVYKLEWPATVAPTHQP